jgi:hypothetical protein
VIAIPQVGGLHHRYVISLTELTPRHFVLLLNRPCSSHSTGAFQHAQLTAAGFRFD